MKFTNKEMINNQERILLYGLAIGCPQKEHCNYCPIEQIRSLANFVEKVQLIKKLPDGEVRKITRFHTQQIIIKDRKFMLKKSDT